MGDRGILSFVRVLHTLALFALCLSIVSGGMVSPAMACCPGMQAQAAEVAQGDDAEMPCHKKAAQNEEDSRSDGGTCECQHCVSTPALAAPVLAPIFASLILTNDTFEQPHPQRYLKTTAPPPKHENS